MKPYFIIAIIILIISVLGAMFANGLIMLFLFSELASLVSFYIFFLAIVPALFPEYRNVDENFNCGASEIYLNAEEIYRPNMVFGGVDSEQRR